ncbi:MAG: Fe-S cluster assembly protein NifU [Candidatus Brocadiia bacterium]
MWDYSEKLKDHFFHPRNVGEIEKPSGVGEVGSLACGDALKLFLKVDDRTGVIEEAKFKTFGCGSAIASASALTEMVKGKSVEEASRITNQDIADYLGGIPPEKMHCSVMGREALEAAIANYRGQGAAKHQQGNVICKCFGVTDEEIKRVVRENRLKTVEDVTHYTKAGGGCGGCKPLIEELIAEVAAEARAAGPQAASGRRLTNIQKIRLIQETLDREIGPALRTDGGDIELVDVDGNRVTVALRGTCAHCIGAEATLRGYVEKKLREIVDPDLVLEEAPK